ncbi:S8 family peptidase [Taibaiella soli]|nr:S8 family peptidase [Taibaiella soli]
MAFASQALQPQWAFRVSFTNKNGTSSLSNPLAFLSQRSLDRRSLHSIAVDSTDLPVSPAYIDSVLAITGGKLHVTSRWLNQCVVLLDDSSKILLLLGKPYVNSVRLVGVYPQGLHRLSGNGNTTLPGNAQSSFSQLARTTGSAAYYGGSYTQIAMVNGDFLHDNNMKGSGELIAVLDAGFSNTDLHVGFDSMFNNGRLLDAHDFVLDTSYVFSNSIHGTAALSTMAGNMPGKYVGTAPEAMYVLYRTEDETLGIDREIEMDNLLAGVERADSIGANIVTASVGYFDFTNPTFTYTSAQLDGKTTLVAIAANTATKKGMLFFSTAGNEGSSGLLSPGDADSAMSVGSVDQNRAPAVSSGYGPNAAGIVKPDVSLMGEPATILSGSDSAVSVASGTSFAAPQLAGWAACLLSGKQNLSPFTIRDAISRSADHYTAPGVQLGYGIPDFHKVASYLGLGVHDIPAPSGSDLMVVWPTVFNQLIYVKFSLQEIQTVQCVLTDVTGKQIFKQQLSVQHTTDWFTINMPPALPSGMYFFTAVGKNGKQTIKLMKN